MCQALEEIMDRKIAKEAAIIADRINSLTLKLTESGRIDDLIQAAKDKTYQDQLFEEFGL